MCHVTDQIKYNPSFFFLLEKQQNLSQNIHVSSPPHPFASFVFNYIMA